MNFEQDIGSVKCNNYRDEIQQIISMAQTNNFKQKVIHSKHKPIAVALFNYGQIVVIKRLCVMRKTVLCINKRYSLGKTYVTVTVFKSLAAFHQLNQERPLFLGPIYFYGKSDHPTFPPFEITAQFTPEI